MGPKMGPKMAPRGAPRAPPRAPGPAGPPGPPGNFRESRPPAGGVPGGALFGGSQGPLKMGGLGG